MVLDSEWTPGLRGELGWLGGELGAARDGDVLLERLTARVEERPEASAETARPVIEALRGDRHIDLIDRLVEAAQMPARLERKAGAATEALPAVRRAWRTLDKHVKAISAPPTDEELGATVTLMLKWPSRFRAQIADANRVRESGPDLVIGRAIPKQSAPQVELVKLKEKSTASREEAAARLHAVAGELASNRDLVIERGDLRLVAHVPEQVNLKVEFEIEDDGSELQLELTS